MAGPSAAPSSPVDKVFGSTELAEGILSKLGPRDLLMTSSVSKHFQALINTSTLLRHCLFIEQFPPTSINDSTNDYNEALLGNARRKDRKGAKVGPLIHPISSTESLLRNYHLDHKIGDGRVVDYWAGVHVGHLREWMVDLDKHLFSKMHIRAKPTVTLIQVWNPIAAFGDWRTAQVETKGATYGQMLRIASGVAKSARWHMEGLKYPRSNRNPEGWREKMGWYWQDFFDDDLLSFVLSIPKLTVDHDDEDRVTCFMNDAEEEKKRAKKRHAEGASTGRSTKTICPARSREESGSSAWSVRRVCY